jgi:hypothetical protein
MLTHILDAIEVLHGADATGERVADWLRTAGAGTVDVLPIEKGGRTDLVRVTIPGTAGRQRGGDAPTLGVIGRLGGLGVRPHRIGLVSDADGAIVALAAASALVRMAAHGDRLRGDVLVRTHISPASPIVPHEPAAFVDVPVDRDALAREEVDARMDAILSVDSTRANRIVKHRGFGITGTVKEGYVLRPTPGVLDAYERVAGHAAVVVPLFTQDVVPPVAGLHRINSILEPATLTDAPVIGVALLSPAVVAGAATGVTDEVELAKAGRFIVEIAKEYTTGALPLYFEDEFRRLVELFGPMKQLQRAT